MGQQQLLLIVLGVIIVGVAIVAGIGMFNANAEEAVKDELINQAVAIGAHAQQQFKKPTAMGGLGLTFVGYEIPDKMQATLDAGTIADDGSVTDAGYVASDASATQLTITATPNNTNYNWTVVATVYENSIQTVVTDAGGAGQ